MRIVNIAAIWCSLASPTVARQAMLRPVVCRQLRRRPHTIFGILICHLHLGRASVRLGRNDGDAPILWDLTLPQLY